MPCGDNCADEYRAREERTRLDEMAQMLCFLCGEMIYGAGGKEAAKVFNTNPRLREWWEQHCAFDFGRVVGEMSAEIARTGGLASKDAVVAAFIKRAEDVHAVSRFHKEWFFGHCYDSAIAGREVFHGQG